MTSISLQTVEIRTLIIMLLFAVPSIIFADTGRAGVDTLNGMKVYNHSCANCHNSGTHNAPKLSDRSHWQKRIFQGEEVLDQHVLSGHLKLPMMHGKKNISDKDIVDAVHFMIVMLRDEPAN